VILGITAGLVLWVQDPEQRTRASDVIGPVVEVLAAVSLFMAAWYSAARSKRQALAWGMLGLATLLYALGDTTWAILELVLRETPFPSTADAFYLAHYPVFLAAVLLLTSLAYLQRLPVRALKMDRSFVHRMLEDRKGLGLVRAAIVSMASDMRMDSVAGLRDVGAWRLEDLLLRCKCG
jgi:hypothetical protein